jgi:antitoxin component YwqK of YwqJK toxin-antitoxin module
MDGAAKTFDKGKLQTEGNYKNDSEDGDWKVYEDDELLKTVTYKDGKIIKEIPVGKKK